MFHADRGLGTACGLELAVFVFGAGLAVLAVTLAVSTAASATPPPHRKLECKSGITFTWYPSHLTVSYGEQWLRPGIHYVPTSVQGRHLAKLELGTTIYHYRTDGTWALIWSSNTGMVDYDGPYSGPRATVRLSRTPQLEAEVREGLKAISTLTGTERDLPHRTCDVCTARAITPAI